MKPSTKNNNEPRGSTRPLKNNNLRVKKALLIIGIAGCFAATSCTVDGYVTDQPADVVYTRPIAPGDGYVWIDGDWVWGGGGYHYHNGHWARPRAGHTWTGGHWDHGARGYHWNRGHW